MVIGPWDTTVLQSIYHITGEQFYPAQSDANVDSILQYVLEDIVEDIKYYVTEAVYLTYSTSDTFKVKLQRCMALCVLQTLHHEHGMVLSSGGQVTSESVSDFASVSYQYPSSEVTAGSFFSKSRKEVIMDTLGRFIPSDAPEQPAGNRSPVHGAFLHFSDVPDQVTT